MNSQLTAAELNLAIDAAREQGRKAFRRGRDYSDSGYYIVRNAEKGSVDRKLWDAWEEGFYLESRDCF